MRRTSTCSLSKVCRVDWALWANFSFSFGDPVDFPAIRGSTVAAVIQAIENGAELAVPVHAGRRGHPLAICPRLIPAIPELDLEVGLRQLLDHHAAAVVEVAVEDPGIHLNVNTPEEYRRLP